MLKQKRLLLAQKATRRVSKGTKAAPGAWEGKGNPRNSQKKTTSVQITGKSGKVVKCLQLQNKPNTALWQVFFSSNLRSVPLGTFEGTETTALSSRFTRLHLDHSTAVKT